MKANNEEVIEVTDETFEIVVLKNDQPVIVIAGTEWCPDTIRMIKQALPKIKSKFSNRICFASVTLEQALFRQAVNPMLKKNLKIERYPTIISFLNGEELERTVSDGDVFRQIADLECMAGKLLFWSE